MKINPINTYTNFGKGKTTFYSDFDGTYYPFFDFMLVNPQTASISKQSFNQMYQGFHNLKKSAGKKFSLKIITGRTKKEVNHALCSIKKSKMTFFMPEEFVMEDGREKCTVKKGIGGAKLNKSKLTSGFYADEKIEKDIFEIVKNHDESVYTVSVPIVFKNVSDEGNEHLIEQIPKSKRSKCALVAQDGLGAMHILFSKGTNIKPYKEEIKKYITKNHISAQVFEPWYSKTQEYIFDSGKFDSSLVVKPVGGYSFSSKLSETRLAVKKIIDNKTNDLIVIAGDGQNDKEMLNPLNYLDLMGVKADISKPPEEILSDPEVLNAIRELPLVSIIVGQGIDNFYDLNCIDAILKSEGINKILKVKDSTRGLLPAVKKSIKLYGEQNADFKKASFDVIA